MHGTLFQLSANPIPKNMYLDPEKVYSRGNTPEIEWCTPLEGEKRLMYIKEVWSNLLPGMFQLNPDGESVTYMGGLKEWTREYVKTIRKKAQSINIKNVMEWIGPAYKLQEYVENPLNVGTLFVFEVWNGGGVAYQSRELIRTISRMQVNDVLYIGAVFDYKF